MTIGSIKSEPTLVLHAAGLEQSPYCDLHTDVVDKSALVITHSSSIFLSLFTAIDCGGLSRPSNGQISIPATMLGSMATYSCDPGYTLDGNASRICGSDGQWSGSQPSCNGECIISPDH